MSWCKAAPNGEAATPSGSVAFCDVLLVEARSRIRLGKFDSRLDELVFLVSEILDDLDTVLVKLDPLHDALAFTAAARLHRDLEKIQSAIPSSSRSRPMPQVRSSRLRCPEWSVDRVDGEVL
jgi:hypothetical protein